MQLLPIAFFPILAAALTSLSINQCPTTFSITTANATSGTELQPFVDLFYSTLFSSQQQAQIESYIINGNTSALVAQITSTSFIAPFIVIAAAFAILFFIVLCCCIFQKSCPPCESWKRDFARRPYEKFQLRCVMVFAVIFSIGILITSIVAFAAFPAMQSDIDNTKCSLYYSLDVALNGDQTNNWGGFTKLQNQIGNISSLLTSASSLVSSNLAGNSWLLTGMQILKQQNLNLYTNNKDSVVYSPDPVATATATSGSLPLPTRVPLFIQKGLGPNGTANTMVTSIDAGLGVTQKLSNQGYLVYQSAQIMAASAVTITANTNAAKQSLSMNSNNLANVNVSLDAFSAAIFDKIFNWALYLIQGIIGFILAGSLLVLLGVLATHAFDIYTCKTTVHIGWVLYGITYFGIIVLTFLFFGLGGLSYVFCQFYSNTITVQASYNTLGTNAGTNAFNKVFSKLNVCFFGDGNILQKFNIASQMQTVTDLFSNIQTFNNYQDATNALYISTATSPAVISGWIAAMEKYRIGVYVDSNPTETTDNNPTISLAHFNQFTNAGTGGVPPTCSHDYWVFDATNCTRNNTQSIYVSSNTVANGLYLPPTGSLCISFNEKLTLANSWSWSQTDLIQRYQQIITNCPVAYTDIISYGSALINYRDSRINLYQSLNDQLNSLLSMNNQFNSNISTFTGTLSTFASSVSTLNNLVTNKIDGLLISSNCASVANSLRYFNNAFCVNFLHKSVKMGICCIALLALMLGGMLTGSVFGMRYARLQKFFPRVMPENLHPQLSETFEKRKDSSDSSSSDDD